MSEPAIPGILQANDATLRVVDGQTTDKEDEQHFNGPSKQQTRVRYLCKQSEAWLGIQYRTEKGTRRSYAHGDRS